MTDITLRPYQRIFIDNVRQQFRDLLSQRRKPAVVGVAPCGAGKTIMTGWMIKQAVERGKRSIFFVHRKELIEQTADTFKRLEIPFGIIAAGKKNNSDAPVQIASVQTLVSRLNQIDAPDFLICDECHHILAKSYMKVLDAFPNAFLLGVTATPLRMGGITLGDVFNSMVESISVNQLIELGNLTKFKYFAPKTDIDLVGVSSSFGEYNNKQLAEVMCNSAITGDIVRDFKRLANDKSAICYCVNVEHSQSVARAFRSAGFAAVHVDGDTPARERADIVNKFRRGIVQILCNAELFGEGFDVPNMQAVILARPTQSLTLFIQQALRPLRPDPNDPNKVAIIIDHVSNFARHGLPNAPRYWSLEPAADDKILCPQCQHFVKPLKTDEGRKCPECGYIWAKSEIAFKGSSRNINFVDGSLDEINIDFNPEDVQTQIKKVPVTPEDFLEIALQKHYKVGWVAYRSIEFARSLRDFQHIAEICGYKPGWAYHHWSEREKSLPNLSVVCG